MGYFQKTLLVSAIFLVEGLICVEGSSVLKKILKPLEKELGLDPDTGLNLVSCRVKIHTFNGKLLKVKIHKGWKCRFYHKTISISHISKRVYLIDIDIILS